MIFDEVTIFMFALPVGFVIEILHTVKDNFFFF